MVLPPLRWDDDFTVRERDYGAQIFFCPVVRHFKAALMTLAWEVQLARAFGWWAVDVSGYLPREQHDKMGVELKPAVSLTQYHHF